MDLAPIRPRRGDRRSLLAGIAAGSLAVWLAGCASGIGDIGLASVDPAKFTFYKCSDLIARNRVAMARERELRELMERAATSPGGALVNVVAYRGEYISIRSELNLLRKVAAERKCTIPEWQSDNVIR